MGVFEPSLHEIFTCTVCLKLSNSELWYCYIHVDVVDEYEELSLERSLFTLQRTF